MLKLYPREQMNRFLFLDLIGIVFFTYNVFSISGTLTVLERIGLLLVTLLSYYIATWYKDWRFVIACTVGTVALGVLSLYTNTFLLIYLFLLTDATGKVRIFPHLTLQSLVLTACHLVVSYLTYDNWLTYFSTALFPFLILQLALPFVAMLILRSKHLKQDLDTAQSELRDYAQEEERNRIARELHDTLGHTLTVIKVKSELAIRLVDDKPSKAKDEMQHVLQTARFASKQVRELVTTLKFVSIESELEHAKNLLTTKSIACLVHGKAQIPKLPPIIETMIAQSIREATLNVFKHSEATTVEISFKLQDEALTVRIEDEGKGFLTDSLPAGHGLDSLRERMRLAQGLCDIASEPGRGTTITLYIPITAKKEAAK